MTLRLLRSTRAIAPRCGGLTLLVFSLMFMSSGCGESLSPGQGSPHASRNEPRFVRVTIVGEKGDFSLVRRDDAKEVYVFTDEVQTRSVAGETVHSIAIDAEFFIDAPSPPRTQSQIAQDRRRAPRLFLTESSRKRVVGNRLQFPGFVDEETGERCFVAYVCNNPDCPARGEDGQPNLFPQGGSAYGAAFAALSKEQTLGNVCPDCVAVRDLPSETDQQRSQYRNWVKCYVLPEEREYHEALDKENRYRIRLLRKKAGWSPRE